MSAPNAITHFAFLSKLFVLFSLLSKNANGLERWVMCCFEGDPPQSGSIIVPAIAGQSSDLATPELRPSLMLR
jgi:hypothetical protein